MDNGEQKPLLVRSELTPPLYSAIRPCDNLITNIDEHGEDAVFENGCYHSVNEEREAQLPEESQSKPGHVTHDTRAYATRWWLLLVTSLCVVMQNAVWATWGPIAKSAEFVFGWNTAMLTVVINCGNMGVLLPLIFTGYLVSRKGLRVSMVTCSFLLALGSGLRLVSTSQTLGTIFICLGQFCNGLAGSVTQVIPTTLSKTWFPSNERTTATAIAVVANAAGAVMAFTLGPYIVEQPDIKWMRLNVSCYNCSSIFQKDVELVANQIQRYMLIDCAPCVTLFLLVLAYFPAKPPRPPSASATNIQLDYKQGLKNAFSHVSLLVVALVSAVPWAVFGNWMGLLSVNITQITQKEAGLLGLSGSCFGVVGGIAIGRLADLFTRRLKQFVVCLYTLTLAMVVWVTCMREGFINLSFIYLMIAVSAIGFFMNGCLPLCYEMSCELAYPIHEGIVGTCLSIAINVSAVLFLLLGLVPNIGISWVNWVLLGSLGAAAVCLLPVRLAYTRSDIDIQQTAATIAVNKATDTTHDICQNLSGEGSTNRIVNRQC